METSQEQESCNAVEKRGAKVLICEKVLGHDPDASLAEREHQMGDERWKDRGGW
jgi:hypothetical protein